MAPTTKTPTVGGCRSAPKRFHGQKHDFNQSEHAVTTSQREEPQTNMARWAAALLLLVLARSGTSEDPQSGTVDIGNTESATLSDESSFPTLPPGHDHLDLQAFKLEYADEIALGHLVEWAYEWVVRDRGYADQTLRAHDLPEFLHRALNPTEEDIDDEERMMIHEATQHLRDEQGLHDDLMLVHVGFLSRGSPLRFLRSLAQRMHNEHMRRRLAARNL